jgi:hypothetical protein
MLNLQVRGINQISIWGKYIAREAEQTMTGRIKKQDHITSLRFPKEWHSWVAQFADRWNVPPAYIYRSAIREFIQRQVQTQKRSGK